jgi:hypothetical protein
MLALVVVLLLNSLTIAQTVYVKAGGGYNFGFPAQRVGEDYMDPIIWLLNSSSIDDTRGIIFGTLGKGASAEGAFGVNLFGKTFGIELGVGYLMGSSNASYKAPDEGYYRAYGNKTVESKVLSFMPSFVVSSELQPFTVYARAGAVLAIPEFKQTTQDTYEYSGLPQSSSSSTERVYEYSGSMGLGINGTLGAIVEIIGINFFVEGSYTNLTWAPTKRVFTRYAINGVDQLTHFTTSEKEIEYVSSFPSDDPGIYDPNKPSKRLKIYFPFSSLGIKAGIVIGL